MKYEEGNILEMVSLNLDKLETAYQLAGRKAKQDVVEDVYLKLKLFRTNIKLNWTANFIDDMLQEIQAKKALPKYIPKDSDLLELLLSAFKGLEEKGQEEILERIFSRKYLGGSKEFEKKIRSRLVTIVRNYRRSGEELEDEELLQEIGIIKTSEDLLFIGPLVIILLDKVVDFTPFCFGASMNSAMIENFEIVSLDVDKVITIENKAAYLEYIKKQLQNPKELVIYLGGFYSPVKRLFLEKIYKFLQQKDQVQFYHWGDIDLGGFNIFLQLQRNIISGLQPMLMDVVTLNKYVRYGDRFDDQYKRKLQSLLDKAGYEIFAPVIKEMLNLGIRLEQEALV